MFCGQCGSQVADGAAFCPNCGAALAGGAVNDFADEELRRAEQRYTGGSDQGYSYGSDAGQSYGGYSGPEVGGYTGSYTGGRGPSWDYTRVTTHTGFVGFLEYWVLMWKNYANKKGRATRMEFWSVVLCNFVIGFLLGLIPSPVGTILSLIYFIAALVPSICVYTRRAHDINQSGSHVVMIYIFLIVGYLLIGIGAALAAVGAIYSWYGVSGMLVGGAIMVIIGLVLLVLYLIFILRLGLKQSWPDDNEYGPYPHKTL